LPTISACFFITASYNFFWLAFQCYTLQYVVPEVWKMLQNVVPEVWKMLQNIVPQVCKML
jgi:hypothetical protein